MPAEAGDEKDPMTDQVQQLKVAELKPSPLQYRKRKPKDHDQKIAELAASMRELGVLEPITARPNGKGQELVFGHRRVEAAKLAGFDTIPGFVREYTDDQVREAQLAENGPREDVHPLDEAQAFAELVAHGQTAAQIADKAGRDKSYVVKRMQLQHLHTHGRKALEEDRVTLGGALALARVPSAQLQKEALDGAFRYRHGPETISTKALVEHIQKHYMLALKGAGFDTTDAELVPESGACAACPKRTGSQVELFNDVKSPDLCTDPACFRKKLDAVWAIRKKEATQPVLDGASAKKALGYDGGYERLDDERWVGGKHVKVSTIVKKAKPEVTLAQDPETGRTVELVKKAEVERAARQRTKEKPDPSMDKYRADQKAQRQKDKLRALVVARCLDRAIAKAEAKAELAGAGDTDLVRAIVYGFAKRASHDDQAAVLKRRGIDPKKVKRYGSTYGSDPEAPLLERIDNGTLGDVIGYGIELALLQHAPAKWRTTDARWGGLLKALGVDPKKVEAAVKDEHKAAEKAKKGKKRPSKKKPAGKAAATKPKKAAPKKKSTKRKGKK